MSHWNKFDANNIKHKKTGYFTSHLVFVPCTFKKENVFDANGKTLIIIHIFTCSVCSVLCPFGVWRGKETQKEDTYQIYVDNTNKYRFCAMMTQRQTGCNKCYNVNAKILQRPSSVDLSRDSPLEIKQSR